MTRDEKIDAMLDKHEITDLLYAYCNAADRHDHVKMRSLYHEDAWDDHGSFFKGPAMEFIDMLPEIQAPMEIVGGRYFDKYEKRDGVWKFSLRAAGADWAYYNSPSQTAMDHPMIAATHIATPGPSDPSYGFFDHMKFGQKLK